MLTIDAGSKALQAKSIDLSSASKCLQVFLEKFENYINEFEDLRKAKCNFDEICEDERLHDPKNVFKVNVFYLVLDIITNQLQSYE